MGSTGPERILVFVIKTPVVLHEFNLLSRTSYDVGSFEALKLNMFGTYAHMCVGRIIHNMKNDNSIRLL